MTFIKVFSKHFSLEDELSDYLARTRKSRNFLKLAATTSAAEIQSSALYLKKAPSLLGTLILARSLFNSGTWLANSTSRVITNHLGAIKGQTFPERDERLHKYCQSLLEGRAVSISPSFFPGVFELLFEKLEQKPVECLEFYKRDDICLVLVPGVFNEFFSTAAFERGAKYLSEKYGLSYISPRISGTKSSTSNSKSLYNSLKAYTEINPTKKLWLLGFSKGGIDALHMMADYPEWANTHIKGLSTIASPILGTKTLNLRTKKLIDRLNNVTDKVFRREILFFLSEFQASLAKEERDSWFEVNRAALPEGPFYSSLGLFSQWYESHVWMMMAKVLLKIEGENDGVVELDHSRFPDDFNSVNLGAIKGHHLIGNRSSYYAQEALLEAMYLLFCASSKI